MKFALVNGDKTEARPGLRGTCVNCQSDTIAKCGTVKIRHWAHKSKVPCDPWWENETEWHRAWKNQYPAEWQEKIHIDSTTGEKHIADIKTVDDLIIEFQHSAIHPNEIKSREAFYKNMAWVVDGTRLKKDYPRFCKAFGDLKDTLVEDFFRLFFPNEYLPQSWLESSKPVYFDFQGITPLNEPDDMRASLWCLLPGRVDQCAIVASISKKQFIDFSSNNLHLLPTRDRYFDEEKRIQLLRAEEAEAKKKIDLQVAEAKKRRELEAIARWEHMRRLRGRTFRF